MRKRCFEKIELAHKIIILSFTIIAAQFTLYAQPTGPCCLVDGSCIVTTEGDCILQGGVYTVDGLICTNVFCIAVPTGACCLPDGSCITASEDNCALRIGIYQGDDTTCDAVFCEDRTIPTLSQWGIIILGLCLVILGFVAVRQKSTALA